MVFNRAIFAYAALAVTAVSAVPVTVVPTNNVVAKRDDGVDFFDVIDGITTLLELLAKRDTVDERSVLKRDWVDNVGHGIEAGLEIIFEAAEKRDVINWDDVLPYLETLGEFPVVKRDDVDFLDILDGLATIAEMFAKREPEPSMFKRDFLSDVAQIAGDVGFATTCAVSPDACVQGAVDEYLINSAASKRDDVDWRDVLDAAETIGELVLDVAKRAPIELKRNFFDDVGQIAGDVTTAAFCATNPTACFQGIETAQMINGASKRDDVDWSDVLEAAETIGELFLDVAKRAPIELKRDFFSDVAQIAGDITGGAACVVAMGPSCVEAYQASQVITGASKRDDVDWSDVLDAAETIGELFLDVAKRAPIELKRDLDWAAILEAAAEAASVLP